MNVLKQKMKFKKKILKFYKKIIFKFKNKINLDKQELQITSLNDLFNHFGTDKGTEVINQYQQTSSKTDQKLIGHGYAKFYEKYLNNFKSDKINILEIGTWKGASVAAFYHYFKNAIIFCIDKNFKFQFESNRVFFFNCDTENSSEIHDLKKNLTKKDTEYFEIIIDDGSHNYKDILSNFCNFFKSIKSGGYYIIEDFNHYRLHQSYIQDSPDNVIDIEEIFENLINKKCFNSESLDKEFQGYCFDNISIIKTHKGIQDFSYIAFIKKK